MNAKFSFNCNAERRAEGTIPRVMCMSHGSLASAHCTWTLNMLAKAKYSCCRVVSLTFGSHVIGRAVKWVCGHSLAGIEGSPGALMSLSLSLSLSPVGLSVVRWWSLRSAYPRQKESYRMCMPECRRGQTKNE